MQVDFSRHTLAASLNLTVTSSNYKMSVDPEDLFSESLESLYGYTPITLSSAGSLFTYTPPNTHNTHAKTLSPITLKTPETQASNWFLHASSIWASSTFLADHLDDLRIPDLLHFARHFGRPLRVLELGAGAGLPSICIAKAYGPDVHVVASDYPDPDLTRTLSENISRNEVTQNCCVVPYAWGSDVSDLLRSNDQPLLPDKPAEGFDLVIAADTLWNSDSHRPFLQTLSLTLHRAPHARVQLVAGIHTGRYTLQSLLDLLPNYGFEIDVVEERNVADGGAHRAWSVEREKGEDDRDRRRWVFWMCLKRT